MPTPEQARLTYAQANMGDERTASQQQRDIVLERAFNRLPFFVEYDRRFQFPAEETVLVNNSPIDMDFDTDGVFDIDFEKYETWTDMKVRIHMSGFMGTGGETVTITAHVTDQAGVETAIPTIARFYFDNATEHHSFYGERRVGDLPPGRYTLTFEWSVSDHTFRFDERDTVYASITECLPIPTF